MAGWRAGAGAGAGGEVAARRPPQPRGGPPRLSPSAFQPIWRAVPSRAEKGAGLRAERTRSAGPAFSVSSLPPPRPCLRSPPPVRLPRAALRGLPPPPAPRFPCRLASPPPPRRVHVVPSAAGPWIPATSSPAARKAMFAECGEAWAERGRRGGGPAGQPDLQGGCRAQARRLGQGP